MNESDAGPVIEQRLHELEYEEAERAIRAAQKSLIDTSYTQYMALEALLRVARRGVDRRPA